MCDSKWPEAVAVLAVAVSVMVVLTPWERVGPINWNAVSGVGALVVAIAAVGVPIWQRAAARKDHVGAVEAEGRAKLELEWVVSNQVNSYAKRLQSLVKEWESRRGIPADSTFDSIRQQLLKASARTTDLFGGTLIDVLLTSVDELQEAAIFGRRDQDETRKAGGNTEVAMRSAVTAVFHTSSSYAPAISRIPGGVAMSETWVKNVRDSFATFGAKPPQWGVEA